MQHLWAPWRATYLFGHKPAGCVFCLKAAQRDTDNQPSDDRANHVLIRGKTCFALLNTFPYTGGHLMIAPYRHTGELNDLTEDELRDLFVMLRRCRNILIKAFKPDGFNAGLNLGNAAGAGIADHLHFHLVPRWNGDTNFMTVLSDTRVVSDGLQATRQKIMDAIEKDSAPHA
ncbi:MAG: HIT domain-containing protein [Verrucomicrobiae bacterium]|nr:HIT domain-containing protein [Verrucomicrobiae bacterium]